MRVGRCANTRTSVRNIDRLVNVMCYQQASLAVARGEVEEQVLQLSACLGIDRGERLVQQQ